jgi:hypothetical protein
MKWGEGEKGQQRNNHERDCRNQPWVPMLLSIGTSSLLYSK